MTEKTDVSNRDDYYLDLGRRAVVCANWVWRPGMLAQVDIDAGHPLPVRHAAECGTGWRGIVQGGTYPNRFTKYSEDRWPDLRDPATLGCLVALTREAWNKPYLTAEYDGHWYIDNEGCLMCCLPGAAALRAAGKNCCGAGTCFEPSHGETEAEAWVQVLEAAP